MNKKKPIITCALQLLDILQDIPRKDFIANKFGIPGTNKSCFIGHINRRLNSEGDFSSYYDICEDGYGYGYGYGYGAQKLANKFTTDYNIMSVNDGKIPKYNQRHPKDRIKAFITDMITAGY